MSKQTTIHDIAKKLNVSIATVSRVLSNSTYPVRVELRKKIMAAAKELNYTPNLLGRHLKQKNSRTLGVIVPSITNPFYSSIVLGVEEIARLNGYQILLCNSQQDIELERNYFITLLENQTRGVIISSISNNSDFLESYLKKNVSVISVDQNQDNGDIYQINFDYHKGGYLATKYLIENGHRKIAFLTAPLDRPSRIGIYKGYIEALNDAGIKNHPDFVKISENTEGHYYDSLYEFRNGKILAGKVAAMFEKPTAIITCNDLTALGAINEFSTRGLRVPDDISVIGFDNIDSSSMSTPPLSTIDHPKYEMGKIACKMLIDILRGDPLEVKEIVLQPKLIIRGSVSPIR